MDNKIKIVFERKQPFTLVFTAANRNQMEDSVFRRTLSNVSVSAQSVYNLYRTRVTVCCQYSIQYTYVFSVWCYVHKTEKSLCAKIRFIFIFFHPEDVYSSRQQHVVVFEPIFTAAFAATEFNETMKTGEGDKSPAKKPARKPHR